MKCLILAGGFATRLYPLTLNKAKALLEFKGKPVITHIINRIPPRMDIFVTTNTKFEKDFVDWCKTVKRSVDLCIEVAAADHQKMGAITAIDYWIGKKQIEEDLMVIAADNYFELDLKKMISRFDGVKTLIAVHDVGDKEQACEIGKRCQVGLVVVDAGKIVQFDEKPEEPTSSIIATGIYILPRRVFPQLSKYCQENRRDNLGDFISFLLARDEVKAHVFTETWVDIGDEIKRGRLSV